MPAATSSPIAALTRRLDVPVALTPGQCPGLLALLAQLIDPRARRGRRHPLAIVLAVAVAAVLAGARSLAAIGEWAADASQAVLAALGVRHDAGCGAYRPPSEATVRRVLARLDADALDRVIGCWLAAMEHGTRAVCNQVDVDGTTNEITRFAPLLHELDLRNTVITADAAHTQREHAIWLVGVKHADYVLLVKDNQPSLHHQLKTLPWADIPVADRTRDRAHGRCELRALQVATVPGLRFPDATQAFRITRRVRTLRGRKWRSVTVYGLTSLTHLQASPAHLADYIRGHWGNEALHHIRDVTFAEDAGQVRIGNAPRALATLRNLAVGILRSCGQVNIAAALRHNARDATRPLALLGITCS